MSYWPSARALSPSVVTVVVTLVPSADPIAIHWSVEPSGSSYKVTLAPATVLLTRN